MCLSAISFGSISHFDQIAALFNFRWIGVKIKPKQHEPLKSITGPSKYKGIEHQIRIII